MIEAPLYNSEGKEVGTVPLPDVVFNVPFNADLVHDVVLAMQANARHPYAHVKDRGEVRGGGKKPWKQKGLGRARHGSIRSPLWVGGGVTHGPRKEKDYSRKINRKVRAKALFMVLSKKWRDGEIMFVDALNLSEPKTKSAKAVLSNFSRIPGHEAIAKKRRNALLVALPEKEQAAEKSFRNIGSVFLGLAKDMNPVLALNHKFIAFVDPKRTLPKIADRKIGNSMQNRV